MVYVHPMVTSANSPMASIKSRKKSKYWVACITRPDGKQVQFSTKLTDPKEALALAVATEASLRKHHTRPQHLRQALSRIADDYSPAELRSQDAAQWLLGWAAGKNNEVTPGTAKAYALLAREAGTWFAANAITSLDAIQTTHVKSLRDHWARITTGATANKKLKYLRIAFSEAVKLKILAENPALDVADVTEEDIIRRPFSDQEFSSLLAVLSGEWRVMVFLGLFTGQRLNDVATLRWSQVDLRRGTITFTARKTGALVSLPLLDHVRDLIAELPAGDDPKAPLLPAIAGKSPSARSNAFRAILASIGLADPVPSGSKKRKKAAADASTEDPGPRSRRRQRSELSFHSLRHTATTMLKSAGVTDSIARAIVGHESVAMSRTYTHLDMETMRAALEKAAAAHAFE